MQCLSTSSVLSLLLCSYDMASWPCRTCNALYVAVPPKSSLASFAKKNKFKIKSRLHSILLILLVCFGPVLLDCDLKQLNWKKRYKGEIFNCNQPCSINFVNLSIFDQGQMKTVYNFYIKTCSLNLANLKKNSCRNDNSLKVKKKIKITRYWTEPYVCLEQYFGFLSLRQW